MNQGKTIIVPTPAPNGRYTKTLWHLKRTDEGYFYYERGETEDMTDDFHAAEERVRQHRLEMLWGIENE